MMTASVAQNGATLRDIDYATTARLTMLGTHAKYIGRSRYHKEDQEDAIVEDMLRNGAINPVDEFKYEMRRKKENGKKGNRKKRPANHINYIMRSANNGRVHASKADIPDALGVPYATWNKFWCECIEKGYISGDEEHGYVLTDVFRYGELPRGKFSHIQKIYTSVLCDLYHDGYVQAERGEGNAAKKNIRKIKCSDHRLIGMLLHLAAYHMHPETNELVENPMETDINQLRPLSDTCFYSTIMILGTKICKDERISVNTPESAARIYHQSSKKELQFLFCARYGTKHGTEHTVHRIRWAVYIQYETGILGAPGDGARPAVDGCLHLSVLCFGDESFPEKRIVVMMQPHVLHQQKLFLFRADLACI